MGIAPVLRNLLAHPLTRGMDIDSPTTTALRRRIIREKRLLREIYTEWYACLAASLPDGPGAVLELGSGAGFLAEAIPGAITSELLLTTGVDLVLSGLCLPFADASLRAIVMTDVLHHMPRVESFFREASRCLRPGGVVAMVEPWVTAWSRLVYTKLHHEPFDATVADWSFPPSGPLSGANGALPWLVFERDREKFRREFPDLEIASIRPMMPFRYLISGGVSLRGLAPAISAPVWRLVERLLAGANGTLGMFAHIVLKRTGGPRS
jgi:SAM-dependent methyltransferase